MKVTKLLKALSTLPKNSDIRITGRDHIQATNKYGEVLMEISPAANSVFTFNVDPKRPFKAGESIRIVGVKEHFNNHIGRVVYDEKNGIVSVEPCSSVLWYDLPRENVKRISREKF